MDEELIEKRLGGMHGTISEVAQSTLMGHILQGLISLQGKNDPRGPTEIKNTIEQAWQYYEAAWYLLNSKASGLIVKKIMSDTDPKYRPFDIQKA